MQRQLWHLHAKGQNWSWCIRKLVYKKVDRLFDRDKTGKNGVDRYYAANAGDADQLESMLREMDAEYLILESDISDEDAVKEIYAAAFDRFGRVDILVNNAAVDDENGLDTIENITPKVIDDTFAVNVRGSILMIRELVGGSSTFPRTLHRSSRARSHTERARRRSKRLPAALLSRWRSMESP